MTLMVAPNNKEADGGAAIAVIYAPGDLDLLCVAFELYIALAPQKSMPEPMRSVYIADFKDVNSSTMTRGLKRSRHAADPHS